MSDKASRPIIEARGIARRFREGSGELTVFADVNFQLARGERTAIVGPSGAGKSTFLHLLGGLDRPSAGEILVDGEPMSALSDAERGRLRNRVLGFVYQFHHLLPEFTALENVAMPLMIAGRPVAECRQRASAILDTVGLGQRLDHKPGELSGGERQRAAVARALVTRPACVLADEPTGNLDAATAERVFNLMLELNRELGTSLAVVTHDMNLARRMDSVWTLRNGSLYRDSMSGS